MKKSRVLLVEPLDRLKESTRLIQLTFDHFPAAGDPLVARPEKELFESTIETRCRGRVLTILGRGLADGFAAKAASLLPENQKMTACDVFQPSLEDIFIALMNEGTTSGANNSGENHSGDQVSCCIESGNTVSGNTESDGRKEESK